MYYEDPKRCVENRQKNPMSIGLTSVPRLVMTAPRAEGATRGHQNLHGRASDNVQE